MSVNFFETACKEGARNEKLFGICDDQDGIKAYTTSNNSEKWVAKVINDNNVTLSFTPIDNCIIVLKEGTNDKESTCDGMLTFTNSLFLVELKDKGPGGWVSDAKGQLENTIKLLNKHQNLENIKYKKAYACNKRHPSFTVIESSERKAFFERTNGFRLDVQAEIVIK